MANNSNNKNQVKLEEASKMMQAYGQAALDMYESNQLLVERIAELEQEDEGWVKFSDMNDSDQFSKAAIDKMARIARLFWIKNPLIKRTVELKLYYLFAQGYNIKAEDEDVQDVINKHTGDMVNRKVFWSIQSLKQSETDLQLSGNLFISLSNAEDDIKVRTIPLNQITDIYQNPDDSQEAWFYVREWDRVEDGKTVSVKEAYYDLFYAKSSNYVLQDTVEDENGMTVDINKDVLLYHVKTNCTSDMDFGISELYAAIDWAKAYKEFLEDWNAITKAYSRIAWKGTSKAGTTGIDKARSALEDMLGTSQASKNLPKQKPGVFVSTDNFDLAPMPKVGATVSANDGRQLKLMVCAATGIYEHYYGDPSTGNLATSKSMERPMELMFTDRQEFWSEIQSTVLKYVLDRSGHEDSKFEVTYPSILQIEVGERIGSIMSATMAGGTPVRTLDMKTVTKLVSQALGIDDDIVDKLYPDDIVPWKDVVDAKSEEGEQKVKTTEEGTEEVAEIGEKLVYKLTHTLRQYRSGLFSKATTIKILVGLGITEETAVFIVEDKNEDGDSDEDITKAVNEISKNKTADEVKEAMSVFCATPEFVEPEENENKIKMNVKKLLGID